MFLNKIFFVITIFFRADLSPDEYESMKEESKQQLVEFNATLSKMSTGNMSLVDELSAMKMVSLFLLATLLKNVLHISNELMKGIVNS